MDSQVRFRRGLLRCLYSQECPSILLKKVADWYFGQTYSLFSYSLRKLKPYWEAFFLSPAERKQFRYSAGSRTPGHTGSLRGVELLCRKGSSRERKGTTFPPHPPPGSDRDTYRPVRPPWSRPYCTAVRRNAPVTGRWPRPFPSGRPLRLRSATR